MIYLVLNANQICFCSRPPSPPAIEASCSQLSGDFLFEQLRPSLSRTAGAPDDPCALLTYNSDFSCIAEDETVVLYDVDQHDREDDKVFAKI